MRMTITPIPMTSRQVGVTAQSEETGERGDDRCHHRGARGGIAFNVRFLREGAQVITETPNLVLETNAKKSPARVPPVGDRVSCT